MPAAPRVAKGIDVENALEKLVPRNVAGGGLHTSTRAALGAGLRFGRRCRFGLQANGRAFDPQLRWRRRRRARAIVAGCCTRLAEGIR